MWDVIVWAKVVKSLELEGHRAKFLFFLHFGRGVVACSDALQSCPESSKWSLVDNKKKLFAYILYISSLFCCYFVTECLPLPRF